MHPIIGSSGTRTVSARWIHLPATLSSLIWTMLVRPPSVPKPGEPGRPHARMMSISSTSMRRRSPGSAPAIATGPVRQILNADTLERLAACEPGVGGIGSLETDGRTRCHLQNRRNCPVEACRHAIAGYEMVSHSMY